MKQTGPIAIIMLFLVVMSCKKESNMYSFFRQTNPKNIKTLTDGEFYSWAATDSSLVRADYYMDVRGEITSYGDSIIAYGHCWALSNNNANPSIGHNFDTLYNFSILPGSTLSFDSHLSNLDADKEYSIRSFAIFGDANGIAVDTGYNPVISKIKTLPAIDEWFEQDGDNRPSAIRFDAMAFNLGDTIFFGTGNQGNEQLTKDINIYNPQTGKWEANFIELVSQKLPNTGPDYEYLASLTNGVGFALTFKPKNAPDYITAVFVGLGDYKGLDESTYKSNTLKKYQLNADGAWDGSFPETDIYPGGSISGAVSFTIGSMAYVGTGSHSSAVEHWFSYDPAKDWDNDPSTFAWNSMVDEPTIKRTGAIAFSVNGRGYFGLGKSIDGTFLKDFWEFRPNSSGIDGTWIKKTDFPGEPRQNAVAFVVGSQCYVGTGDNIIGDMEGVYTGETFSDLYRYDPFNDNWEPIADYTTDKQGQDIPKKVTRACGFSGATLNFGFVGFGIMPEETTQRAQKDYWKYQPWKAK